jgi:hypothetical protein
MPRVLTLALALLASGCGVATEADPACEAGKVEACPCPDGSQGAQTCKSDGSAWGECQCSMLTLEQAKPDVSCRTEIAPEQIEPIDRCPSGKRQFLLCDMPIVQSGVCYRDEKLLMYCCSPG